MSELGHDSLRNLLALRDAATPGDWHLERGLMGNNLSITSWWREQRIQGKGAEGSIARVWSERYLFPDGDPLRKVPIKRAEADAAYIVAAANALPHLVKMILGDLALDESAWLIEWPADKYAPLRYYAAGEQAVMSANDATRFCRKSDAEAVKRAEKLTGVNIVEHLWMRAPTPTPEQPS